MKLSKVSKKYPALKKVIERVEEVENIKDLYPPQADAINAGVLDGKNLVLSIPTASGKTLVSEFAMLNEVLHGSKAIYLVPLRALASEKYQDLTEKYSQFAKIGMSTGEYDSPGKSLAEHDILILTVEKLDSLMRHSPPWLSDVGLVVLDEVHLLDSPNRGPTLEIVITQLKQLKGVQFLALSATIENGDELSDWLDAELVESEFRPIRLSKGVYLDGEVTFKEKDDLKISHSQEPSVELALDIVKKEAQSLIFVNTRRGAESEAEKNATKLYQLLSTKEKKELQRLSEQILDVLDRPTKQCIRLANCVRKGAAFHHAGLHARQRKIIEENFKQNLLKVISATPTLAAGVNLPSKRVVIREYKRYGTFGMTPIPILEIHQMFGRAGRPKYDTEGEAILIAKTLPEFEQLWDHYIEGRPEPISSKLGVEPVLRMHILGMLAQTPLTKESLLDFFSQTFYAYQYSNLEGIETMVDKILDQLFDWKFINYSAKNRFDCTPLGRRVAQLYLDPLTAHDLLELLKKKVPDDMILLTILSDTAEMRPLATVRRSEELEIYEQFGKYDLKEEQLRAFKNAMVFFEWMNEVTDDKLFDKYSIAPGTLRTKLDIADWLLYATAELSRLTKRDKIIPKTEALRKRLKYGVKMELLPLVRIRNIGRVRARKLFSHGYKNIEDIKAANPKKIADLIGSKIAEKIFTNLDIKFEKEKEGLEKYL